MSDNFDRQYPAGKTLVDSYKQQWKPNYEFNFNPVRVSWTYRVFRAGMGYKYKSSKKQIKLYTHISPPVVFQEGHNWSHTILAYCYRMPPSPPPLALSAGQVVLWQIIVSTVYVAVYGRTDHSSLHVILPPFSPDSAHCVIRQPARCLTAAPKELCTQRKLWNIDTKDLNNCCRIVHGWQCIKCSGGGRLPG